MAPQVELLLPEADLQRANCALDGRCNVPAANMLLQKLQLGTRGGSGEGRWLQDCTIPIVSRNTLRSSHHHVTHLLTHIPSREHPSPLLRSHDVV